MCQGRKVNLTGSDRGEQLKPGRRSGVAGVYRTPRPAQLPPISLACEPNNLARCPSFHARSLGGAKTRASVRGCAERPNVACCIAIRSRQALPGEAATAKVVCLHETKVTTKGPEPREISGKRGKNNRYYTKHSGVIFSLGVSGSRVRGVRFIRHVSTVVSKNSPTCTQTRYFPLLFTLIDRGTL